MIPYCRYVKEEQESEIRTPLVALFVPTVADMISEGLKLPDIFKDVRIVPDKSSYQACPWNDRVGLVFAQFQLLDGSEYRACPQSTLKRAIKELAELGYQIKSGIEIEFYL